MAEEKEEQAQQAEYKIVEVEAGPKPMPEYKVVQEMEGVVEKRQETAEQLKSMMDRLKEQMTELEKKVNNLGRSQQEQEQQKRSA